MEPLSITRLRRALNDNYVLVLTTNSVERKAVAECLDPSAKATISFENDGARIGVCGDQLILHVTGTSGGQADKAVGRITRRILNDRRAPRPKAVVLVGIGWGAPNGGGLGTVILCGELLAVNQQRIDGDQPRYISVPRSSPWLSELDGIAGEFRANSGKTLKVGVLASGEQFIARDSARDTLLASFPGIAGGEMEGWDLVPDLEGLPWVQLRGVCDFAGDDTNRLHQTVAAMGAAEFLKPLLLSLQVRERLTPIRRDPATISLIEALAGESMEITDPADGMGLDAHLNYRLGPSLIWRLAQYAIGVPTSSSLPRLLTNLLLEMGQNALKHGGATHASIQFGGNSVAYSDDGSSFDLFSLVANDRGRGGRKALADVQRHLVASNIVELVAEPPRRSERNRYRISFPKLSAQLREARERCSVEIAYHGSSRICDQDERLDYDRNCQVLFFDASELLMSSRRFDVIEELRDLLCSGKQLFIQCADEHEKAYYEDALSDVGGERLNVLVVPTVSSPSA